MSRSITVRSTGAHRQLATIRHGLQNVFLADVDVARPVLQACCCGAIGDGTDGFAEQVDGHMNLLALADFDSPMSGKSSPASLSDR
ncbi:hypothetical protein [Amycolatopsis japonica]